MAFVGWYIQKKNWFSVLIFAPVFLYLGNTIFLDGKEAIKHFPHMIIATIFCILQILLYVYVFFPKKSQKAADQRFIKFSDGGGLLPDEILQIPDLPHLFKNAEEVW